MPGFGFRTIRRAQRSVAGAISAQLSGLGKVVSDLVAGIARGLAPAPVLQPIPVRVRDRRRHRG